MAAGSPGRGPLVHLGPLNLWSPVILAPMAGVTDLPFRRLCREFGERPLDPGQLSTAEAGKDAPAGLYVMEMVTARALVEGNRETWRMLEPDPDERVRSVQLYGTNPATMAEAARLLVDRHLADHLDMNFGCPVPKVTKRGGGAALPWKLDLYRDIVTGVVREADRRGIPVTVKMRIGIDDDHVTVFEAARIAQAAGVVAVGLHARTQEQYYSGHARWEWIARLKEQLKVPVLGNGDIFSAQDAREMMAQTGCDAVVIGRGCQGRPWLFEEIVADLWDRSAPTPPNLGQVCRVIERHADLMVQTVGEELRAMREMRKHLGWYLRGFSVGGATRQQLGLVSTRAELSTILATLNAEEPFPEVAAGPRGRAGKAKRPHLPDGWLSARTVSEQEKALLHLAEADGGSGG